MSGPWVNVCGPSSKETEKGKGTTLKPASVESMMFI